VGIVCFGGLLFMQYNDFAENLSVTGIGVGVGFLIVLGIGMAAIAMGVSHLSCLGFTAFKKQRQGFTDLWPMFWFALVAAVAAGLAVVTSFALYYWTAYVALGEHYGGWESWLRGLGWVALQALSASIWALLGGAMASSNLEAMGDTPLRIARRVQKVYRV
jgi:hypothetical protein